TSEKYREQQGQPKIPSKRIKKRKPKQSVQKVRKKTHQIQRLHVIARSKPGKKPQRLHESRCIVFYIVQFREVKIVLEQLRIVQFHANGQNVRQVRRNIGNHCIALA